MSMEISLNTTLTTERLLLRPVDLSDVELVWEATRFDGFNDGMTWDPPASREDIVEVTHRNLAHWSQGKDYVFTVCLTCNGNSIGRVGLHREETPGTWNIGFWIHPDHWAMAMRAKPRQQYWISASIGCVRSRSSLPMRPGILAVKG